MNDDLMSSLPCSCSMTSILHACLSLSLPLSLSYFFQPARPSVYLTDNSVLWKKKKSIAFNVAHVRVDYLYHTYTQLNIWNGYSIDHRSHWRLCISASWCSPFFNSAQIVELKSDREQESMGGKIAPTTRSWLPEE
jgi:hypothetical protein